MLSAWRERRLFILILPQDPGIFRTAALTGIHDDRILAQGYAGEPARQQPSLLAGHGEGPEVDMARLHAILRERWANRKLNHGLADVVRGIGLQLLAGQLDLGLCGFRPDANAIAAG